MNSNLIKTGLLSFLTLFLLFTSCSEDDNNIETDTNADYS